MGDLHNCTQRVRSLLKRVQYPQRHTTTFETKALLQILHYSLLEYSRGVAEFILSKNYDLYGKTDARFVESTFRLLRDEFRYFPPLTVTQFLSAHYTERKLNLVADILRLIVDKNSECQWRKRQQQAVWTKPKQHPKDENVRVENHSLPAVATLMEQLQLKMLAAKQKEAPRPRWTRPEVTFKQASYEGPNGVRRISSKSMQAPAWGSPDEECTAQPVNRESTFKTRYEHSKYTDDEVPEVDCSEAIEQRSHDLKIPHSNAETSCPCNAADLAQTLSAISEQISRLSDTFMTKISTVEDRLGRMERQIHDVTAQQQQQQQQLNHQLKQQSSIQPYSSTLINDSTAKSSKRFQVDSCSWPPEPSVFERH